MLLKAKADTIKAVKAFSMLFVDKPNNRGIVKKCQVTEDITSHEFQWMHRLRGGISMIKNLMQKLILMVQKLMICLYIAAENLSVHSEGSAAKKKDKEEKSRGFPEQRFNFTEQLVFSSKDIHED
ncbi:hypothetical protein Tco_0625644 [Tanacetum coccineum]|uniref:Uncharacterized protein n=1 Tax=Tanacetum coccineum TaxID=301880 RepID=A0ABQ4WHF8_9ASTR